MNTKTLRDKKIRRELKKGVDHVGDTVRITVGPKGRNVVLEREYNVPEITNDAYTIIKDINLRDRFQNQGVQELKDISQRTNDEAGDGRTTAAILAQAMYSRGLRYVDNLWKKRNPVEIRIGMLEATKKVIDEIQKEKKPIKKKGDIYRIALISSESPDIAEVVTTIMNKIGKNGVVNVAESNKDTIEFEMSKGMEIPTGYFSPHMVTNQEKKEAVFEKPKILVTDKKIVNINDIVPLIQYLGGEGISHLVVIADDIGDIALQTMLINNLNGPFQVLAIKAPGFAEERAEWLQDIASVVGAEVVSGKTGDKYAASVLGECERVIAKNTKTTFIGGKGETILRMKQIQEDIENSKGQFEKKKLEERLARISGGIGLVRVGASTEAEMKYLKRKVDDTVHSVQAAMQEGYVEGGGVALAKASRVLRETPKDDRKYGYKVVEHAVKQPLIQIAKNAGKNGEKVLFEVLRSGSGYDAKRDVFVASMIDSGIIDPVKVVRSALKNATSGAAQLLTSGAAIVYDEVSESTKNY